MLEGQSSEAGHAGGAGQSPHHGLADPAEAYRLVFETTPHGIVFQDAEGRVIAANPAAERILGLSLDQLRGRSSIDPRWEAIHEDGTPFPGDTHPAMEALRTNRPVPSVVMGIRNPMVEGLRWIHVSAIPLIRPGESEPYQAMATFVDITERERAEAERAQVQRRLQRAERVAHFGNWECDLPTRTIQGSEGARRIYGLEGSTWSLTQVQGIPLPEDRPKLDRALADLLERGLPYDVEFRIGGPDQEAIRTIHSNAEYDATRQTIFGVLQDITVRKRAEQALLDSERSLQQQKDDLQRFFQASVDLLCLADTEGRLLRVNEAWTTMLGHGEAELVGAHFLDLVHPEDRAQTLEAVAKLAGGGTVIDFVNRYRAKDGSWHFLEWRSSAREGVIFAGARDITGQRAAEGRVQEANELFSLFMKHSPIYVYIKEVTPTESRVIQASENFIDMVGIPAASMIGKTMVELFPPEFAAKITADDWATVSRREITKLDEDLHGRHYTTIKFPIHQGDRVLLAGYTIDITERKKAEAERSRIFERISDAFVALDRDWRYTFVNAKAGQMFGRRPEDLVGKHIWTEFPEGLGQKFHLAYERAMATQQDIVIEEYYPPYDQWFENHIYPSSEGLSIYFHNITERKKAEEDRTKLQAQLHQVQKMESLGSLAGGVAHDMNNVLGAILGLASANLERQTPGDPAWKTFTTIIRAAERGGKMVKSLLSFARQTKAEEQEVGLNEILQDEVHLLERTTLARVRIDLDLAPDLRPVLGDASALAHAFMNLCVNAVDAMPENGTLILRTRNAGSDRVVVTVEDTGTGMTREVLERAMDPFYTTKAQGKGTGLGLSMVYSTVVAHNGRMDLQSEPGRGTTVRMDFPACLPKPQEAEAPGRLQPDSPKPVLKVLLVDDDELILNSTGVLLEALGHAVTSAQSGEEALVKLRTGLQPDLVILDLNMPGLGGGETLPRLRVLCPEVPVLVSTGRADQAALDIVEGDRRTTLLAKPFSMDELRARIEAVARIGKGRS